MLPGTPVLRDLMRYGMALVGPVGVAGTQFLLSIGLLRTLEPATFGRYSFLLIVAQLSWALWSALFCAPLPLLLAGGPLPSEGPVNDTREAMLRSLTAASLLGAVAAMPVFAALAWMLGDGWRTALLFGAFGGLAIVRFFGRALAYAVHRPLRAMASDIVYGLGLLGGIGVIWFEHAPAADTAYAALAVAAGAGLLPFVHGDPRRIRQLADPRRLAAYPTVWREHGRWSLLGVATTEMTANVHAYLITLFLGPGAFAPLAASALLIRPIAVATNAIVEYERPRLAQALQPGQRAATQRATRLFRAILIAGWVAVAAANAAILVVSPGLIYPGSYDRAHLAVATTLWLATALLRILSVPEGTLLQAIGRFRPLAMASLWSSAVSLASVALLLIVAAPIWSILGILAGEAVVTILVLREGRRALMPESGTAA
ncbi:hypothetical protein ACFSGX_02195 [Sphingomonas arantia]|uniref:Polysaccharide biosynthesis protein n=1 Tax=Sphingomonas arantia TaxID=1460676 RepID=A0ABW4TVK2_9SPHN